MGSLTYLRHFIKDPNIASIAPTSSFGIKRMCAKMDFSKPLVIVEYGPATGVITRALLKQMNSESRMIAIDTNDRFLDILRREILDPRLEIHHASASDVRDILERSGHPHADYIISGIPFTMLPRDVADQIVGDTYETLAEGGKFIVYQFLKPEKNGARGIHTYLPKHFSVLHKEIEWLNIPPLWIYEAQKAS